MSSPTDKNNSLQLQILTSKTPSDFITSINSILAQASYTKSLRTVETRDLILEKFEDLLRKDATTDETFDDELHLLERLLKLFTHWLLGQPKMALRTKMRETLKLKHVASVLRDGVALDVLFYKLFSSTTPSCLLQKFDDDKKLGILSSCFEHFARITDHGRIFSMCDRVFSTDSSTTSSDSSFELHRLLFPITLGQLISLGEMLLSMTTEFFEAFDNSSSSTSRNNNKSNVSLDAFHEAVKSLTLCVSTIMMSHHVMMNLILTTTDDDKEYVFLKKYFIPTFLLCSRGSSSPSSSRTTNSNNNRLQQWRNLVKIDLCDLLLIPIQQLFRTQKSRSRAAASIRNDETNSLETLKEILKANSFVTSLERHISESFPSTTSQSDDKKCEADPMFIRGARAKEVLEVLKI